ADAGISDSELEVGGCLTQADLDLPVERKLEGVGNEIEDDLLPHLAVDEGRLAKRRAVDRELEAGLLYRRAEHARQLRSECREFGRPVHRLHSPCLDAREFEKCVGKLQQPETVAMNEFQLLVLRNGERRGRAPKLRLEILERSEHQGERRAELVA